MILGMALPTLTFVHVALSLIGIAAGMVVVAGFLRSRSLPLWTATFLGTTFLAGVTGFFFPVDHVLPSHIVGVITLVALAGAWLGLLRLRVAPEYRVLYVTAAVAALYLNVFVGIVQAFLKIAALHSLAPTQQELPFLVTQGVAFVLFIAAGFFAIRSCRRAGTDLNAGTRPASGRSSA